jgi:hypothetical protein
MVLYNEQRSNNEANELYSGAGRIYWSVSLPRASLIPSFIDSYLNG